MAEITSDHLDQVVIGNEPEILHIPAYGRKWFW